ncbi:hypothetical protein ASPWEDRAFT_37589 [Aspergillus wentii DTO 134E9]|uniref:MYB family conidiophore development protein FlbD n=1 Tax=Aspergillus wentii DTO 134E9 TaxID=1073089 RepID=A0A1L9RXX8_ASPWE|nr:uncharacterized protein ASPWEDRAFT_37589 [Aspergillus wentii DTO 134E9]KAI9931576.1 hypothetical protein MW887_010153 [Aspergillus wentii]OJJ39753.1 hypothetical protein ASPWEDRAFT_37589 [Aspergillus wentii DTO 134E9]
MAPTHRRGPWVPEEDQLLLQLVREQGPNNWVRISQHMHYRSPKQCRERFHQNLKPSLNREPISADEGLMIERMVNEMGKRWAEIARRLGNRSDNAVKNWWNGSMNRKRRGGVPSTSSSRTFNGRIEAPYQRASIAMSSPARSRFSSISHDAQPWTKSPASIYSSNFSPDSRRESIDCPRQLTPIFTLPSINRPVETPLTSPAFSETSNAPSLEPPSMVSDHNSVSSSPRTIASPQLLPLPVDLRQQYEPRRQSASSVTEDAYYGNYSSTKTLESLPDYALKPRWIPDPSASWSAWPRTESLKMEPSRDSRMGLNNLLN